VLRRPEQSEGGQSGAAPFSRGGEDAEATFTKPTPNFIPFPFWRTGRRLRPTRSGKNRNAAVRIAERRFIVRFQGRVAFG
jgi:hypothetical protein